MTDTTPRRIEVAMKGGTAIVLRATHRRAVETMHEDLGIISRLPGGNMDGAVTSSAAHTMIRTAAGGWIRYIGGQEHHLEERLRGYSVDHLDGALLVSHHAARFTLKVPVQS